MLYLRLPDLALYQTSKIMGKQYLYDIRVALLTAIVGLIYQSAFSQATNTIIGDLVMQPPNAAAFSKYGDIPVNLSTGSANVTIPIHTIEYGDLRVPSHSDKSSLAPLIENPTQ